MNAVPILLYHSVCEHPGEDLWRWSLSPAEFARHLDAVVGSGRVPFSVSGYLEARSRGTLPERAVVVTFDDGYADFAEHALPALAERALPSTLYVTTGGLGSDGATVLHAMPRAPMLRAADLPALEAAGVEIGSHSVTHPELDAVGPSAARREIVESKASLEKVLGHAVASFAYPHGFSGPLVRRLASSAGYRSACGVRNAFSPVDEDEFALSRLMVERGTPFELVSRWLAGDGAPVAPAHEARRTQVYRWTRRARHATRSLLGSSSGR